MPKRPRNHKPKWQRTGIKCPKPEKAEFATKSDAKLYLKENRLGKLTIYHCDCGVWHYTSQPVEVSRDIHRAVIRHRNGDR